MPSKQQPRRPDNPAVEGDLTPMHPEEVTLGRIEQETGQTREQVAVPGSGRTVTDGEIPIEEQRRRGIEDNVRHVDSIGRR
jgi:hypothetical protein